MTGRNYKEEKGKLEVYGLEVIIEQRTVSDDTDYDSEEIIGQSVDPGTELKKGDKITLYIPKIEEKYPDMVGEGWTVAEAEEWAKEKGIVLEVIEQETNDYEPGTIISQSRGTDSVVVEGVTLRIYVAKKREDTPDTPTDGDNAQDEEGSEGQENEG